MIKHITTQGKEELLWLDTIKRLSKVCQKMTGEGGGERSEIVQRRMT